MSKSRRRAIRRDRRIAKQSGWKRAPRSMKGNKVGHGAGIQSQSGTVVTPAIGTKRKKRIEKKLRLIEMRPEKKIIPLSVPLFEFIKKDEET